MRAVKTIFLLFCLVFVCAVSCRAGDDIQAVTALWNDFVQALRRGDYQRAHGLFSPESQASLPYAEFVLEYGPLTLAREMVLAKPESLSTRLDGDWAELNYGGFRPGTGKPFKVGVGLARNLGAWGLVAARNEEPERVEAAARTLLQTAASVRGLPNAREVLDKLFSGEGGKNPALQHYRFESDGAVLKAIAVTPGLRTFHVDEWGQVKPGDYAFVPPPPGDQVEPPPHTPVVRDLGPIPELGESLAAPKPPPSMLVNGLPELSEPPPLPARAGDDDLPELAPPPPLPRPPAPELPDVIQ